MHTQREARNKRGLTQKMAVSETLPENDRTQKTAASKTQPEEAEAELKSTAERHSGSE